jgi:hypothetical protein
VIIFPREAYPLPIRSTVNKREFRLRLKSGQFKDFTEVWSFVRRRFPKMYQQSRAGYSPRLRGKIQRVFGFKLSGECLQTLPKALREELRHEVDKAAGPSGDPGMSHTRFMSHMGHWLGEVRQGGRAHRIG